ncbi:helix-turn-helix domain-containing protein [Enterococcus sp. LJL90]
MGVSVVENIKRIGKGKEMTVKQIGRESGVGENAIYRWDKNYPNLSSLKKVADYLEVPIDKLLESKSEVK